MGKNRFEYYYGKEADQFSFYRIPKLLFTDEQFKGLSNDVKLLYGLMLDRMSLSIKNTFILKTTVLSASFEHDSTQNARIGDENCKWTQQYVSFFRFARKEGEDEHIY